jgi:hypothetical protein
MAVVCLVQMESGTAVTMEGIDLAGDGANAKKRMHIYRALLQHMNDESRILVRLCSPCPRSRGNAI